MNRRFVCALVASGVCIAAPTSAESPEERLGLDRALQIAAERAPEALASRGEVEIARASVVSADVVPHNPELEVGGGPRFADGSVTPDVEVGIGQRFELGPKRRSRTELAKAGVDVASADARQARRTQLTRVAELYVRAVHAERRVAIAQRSVELAGELAQTAQKRLDAGETNRLEVNTARLGEERFRVQVELWRGRVADLHGGLRGLLDLPAETNVVLTTPLEQPALPDDAELLEQLAERPDLVRLRNALRREEARARLADAARWPAIGVRLGYAREEGADILRAALSVPLPIFSNGQGIAAEAGARTTSLTTQLGALERQARTEVVTARKRYETLRAAAVRFQNEVLPLLERNEAMVRRAYEAGSVDLSETLAMRREMIEARQVYTDLLLEAALANVRVRAATGSLDPRNHP